MNAEQNYLMHLFSCAATGKVAELPTEPMDWDALVRLAREQSVVHFVALAIKKNRQIPIPEPMRSSLLSALTGTALRNKLRAGDILSLLERMRQAGISSWLLKGQAVARLYAYPECRESADTDVLVLPEQEMQVLDFLRAEGFSVTPREAQMHHARCLHPTYGLFEVHISLWEEDADALMFDSALQSADLQSRTVTAETEDGCFQTIDTANTLLFVTLHTMKHFINNGASLRMLMDLCLYYREAEQKTDGTQYWETLRRLHFDKTIRALLTLGIRYFGFSFAGIPTDAEPVAEEAELLAEDIFSGGWNGTKQSESRYDCYQMYRHAMQKRQLGTVETNRRLLRQSLPYLLLSVDALSEEYPILRKCRWLYVFLSVWRFAKKAICKPFKAKTDAQKQRTDEAEQRLQLLKKMNIL